MVKKWARLSAVLMALCVLGTSCGTAHVDEAKPEEVTDATMEAPEPPPGAPLGGRLVMGVQTESSGWDPNMNPWDQAAQYVISSVLEPLSLVTPEGEIEPWLATSWQPNADYSQWTITVRDDVMLHNGEHLDSKLLKANLMEWFQRTPPEKLSATAREWLGVDVVGPYSVQVNLAHSYPEFAVRNASTPIIAQASLDDDEHAALHPIGTGPFVFDRWEQDKAFTAKRFDHYWQVDSQGRRKPYLDSIEFRPIRDEQTRVKALESGDVTVIQSLSSRVATELDPSFTVLRDFDSERTLIVLNADEGSPTDGLYGGKTNAPNPFKNLHARKALAYAINRDTLTGILGADGEAPSSTPQPMSPKSKWAVPPGTEGYYPYDPQKAKEELQAYEHDTGKNVLSFEVLVSSSPEEVGVFQAIQSQLAEVGIDMRIANLEQLTIQAQVFWGVFQATGWRWFGSRDPLSAGELVDPQSWAPVGEYTWDLTRNRDPIFDHDLQTLRRDPNENARRQASASLTRTLNQQALCIWLHDTPWSLIADPRVRGLNFFRAHPFGNYAPRPGWADVWQQQ